MLLLANYYCAIIGQSPFNSRLQTSERIQHKKHQIYRHKNKLSQVTN